MHSIRLDGRLSFGFLLFAIITLSCSIAFGQKHAQHDTGRTFCSGNSISNDRAGHRELRELTLPASGRLEVDGGRNGGIRVKGEQRTDIAVRACVQTWGQTEEAARAEAAAIRISAAPVLKAEGSDNTSWGVSYEISVPHNTDLKLAAHNGGISISSVQGDLDFETSNGGIMLSDVAGSVRGRTTNGGVNVKLSGSGWLGSGLDLVTTNGGVHLTMPENYAARVETGTTNGGFTSNIVGLSVDNKARPRPRTVTADINGGGAPIRVMTTNGGVRITSEAGVKY